MNNPIIEHAKQAAHKYLRFKLGGRRGCRVLEGIEESDRNEIIEECAATLMAFSNAVTADLRAVAEELGYVLRTCEVNLANPMAHGQLIREIIHPALSKLDNLLKQ